MAQIKKCCRFNSNDIYPISADSTMPFAQHRDIFTSGVDQEESILLLFQMLLTSTKSFIFKRN
jgi:hypothetical protein